MTAKIEAGKDWHCGIYDIKHGEAVPVEKWKGWAWQAEQPITLSALKGPESLVLKYQNGLTNIIVNTGRVHTELKNQDNHQLNPIKNIEGMVIEGGNNGEGFALIGPNASIQFGQPGSPEYLKVTNEVEYPGKVISE